MKTRNNASEFSRQILSDIKMLPAEEVHLIHGITIDEHGKVYDQAYDKTFATIVDWISFAEEDQDNEFEKFGGEDRDYN